MLLPPLLLLPGCVLPSGLKRFCACLPFYEVRRRQSGKLHTLQGQWGHAGDHGEGSGSLGLWAEVGGPLTCAHSPCSPPPVGGLLGPSRSSERKLRPLQSGVTWRGAVAQGCLGQVLGWGQAGRWAPSCWWWPCWAPGRVGVRAGLARAEGGLVEVGAGPPSGAEVGVPCGLGGCLRLRSRPSLEPGVLHCPPPRTSVPPEPLPICPRGAGGLETDGSRPASLGLQGPRVDRGGRWRCPVRGLGWCCVWGGLAAVFLPSRALQPPGCDHGSLRRRPSEQQVCPISSASNCRVDSQRLEGPSSGPAPSWPLAGPGPSG